MRHSRGVGEPWKRIDDGEGRTFGKDLSLIAFHGIYGIEGEGEFFLIVLRVGHLDGVSIGGDDDVAVVFVRKERTDTGDDSDAGDIGGGGCWGSHDRRVVVKLLG